MPKDLLLIILGVIISHAYFYWQDYKRKQKEKQQERLNQIK
jgi:preprotein translocase subunit YajC